MDGEDNIITTILFSDFWNVFDIIYKPKFTKLILNSKKNKLKVLSGLDMNLRQAVLAFGYTNNKLKTNKQTLQYMRSTWFNSN